MSDYYAELGVDRDATPEQIKKAYRKLARELHPDVNPSPEAADRFKAVSQAYDVLSSPEKRQNYDMGGSGGPGGGFGAGFGFADIFEQMFTGGQSQRGPIPRQQRGQDALLRVEIDLETVVFGGDKEITFDSAVLCTLCRGTCCSPGSEPKTCDMCRGSGQIQRVVRSILGQVMTASPCSGCNGHGTVIPNPCPECAGEGRVRQRRASTVKIPAGVETGTRIRLTAQSEVGPAGGPPGDLYLEVRERRHDTFVRREYDLHCNFELPMTAAALGTTFTIGTFDGDQEIDVRPGTQSGDVITLRGLGVTHLRGQGRGDLIVRLDVRVPRDLTDEQQALLRQLAELRDEVRPEGKMSAAHGGFFSRIKDAFKGH
ncbi:molecular chaperone DnaJ [Micrococcales bacterium 31B]|nr:molecular chaperone DnaJ [Micrococcales bacterium 31B]